MEFGADSALLVTNPTLHPSVFKLVLIFSYLWDLVQIIHCHYATPPFIISCLFGFNFLLPVGFGADCTLPVSNPSLHNHFLDWF
jgi:hypothetical protein